MIIELWIWITKTYEILMNPLALRQILFKVLCQFVKYIGTCNFRFQLDDQQKYLSEVQELIRPERNTLTVSYEDVEKFNQQLAVTILEEYYRYSTSPPS